MKSGTTTDNWQMGTLAAQTRFSPSAKEKGIDYCKHLSISRKLLTKRSRTSLSRYPIDLLGSLLVMLYE